MRPAGEPDDRRIVTRKKKAVLKVAVFADSRLTVNGKVSTIGGLLRSLYARRKSIGTIWYYREPSRQANPIASDVLLTLSLSGLPIQFAGKPDFSDRV